MYDKNWARVDAAALPSIKTELPGPKSSEYHSKADVLVTNQNANREEIELIKDKGLEIRLV